MGLSIYAIYMIFSSLYLVNIAVEQDVNNVYELIWTLSLLADNVKEVCDNLDSFSDFLIIVPLVSLLKISLLELHTKKKKII